MNRKPCHEHPDINQTLERLRELEAKARKAPWRAAPGKGTACLVSEAKGEECQIYLNVRTAELDETVKTWQDTAAFIAELRNALPALLAHIESLTKRAEAAEANEERFETEILRQGQELVKKRLEIESLQSLADQRGRDLVELDEVLRGLDHADEADEIRERNPELFKGE